MPTTYEAYLETLSYDELVFEMMELEGDVFHDPDNPALDDEPFEETPEYLEWAAEREAETLAALDDLTNTANFECPW